MALRFVTFVTNDIWGMRLEKEASFKKFLVRSARVMFLSVQGFIEDNCQLRASALTFYTLISIVPLAAIIFGVARGFGLDKMIQNYLLQNLSLHEDVLVSIIVFSNRLLENTKGGLIAGIGVIVLLWAAVSILSTIEASFNEIWKIRKSRPFSRKLSDYISFMILGPLLFITSVSATLWLSGKVRELLRGIPVLNLLIPAIVIFLGILILWTLFTLLYIVIPNTRVPVSSGVAAGIAAGTIYQLVQWAYIYFQIGAAKYGAIYGSLAALPLFLIWLQISWYIVLLGAEISFSYKNSDTYGFLPLFNRVDAGSVKLLLLRIMQRLEKNFLDGLGPMSPQELSRTLEIPGRLVNRILLVSAEAGLVIEAVNEKNGMVTYTIGKNPEAYTVGNIVSIFEKHGIPIPARQAEAAAEISARINALNDMLQKSPLNVNLRDLP